MLRQNFSSGKQIGLYKNKHDYSHTLKSTVKVSRGLKRGAQ